MAMGILTWIAVGLVAGWLAGQFMRSGFGLVGDVVLGIVGAVVAGYVGGLILGRDLMITGFNLESVAIAFVGAVAVLAMSRLFSRRRRMGVS